jgi:hypothetical protein
MNHQIRILAEQAIKKYDRLGNEIPFAQPDLEKFAELIVLECIDIIAPYTVRMSRPGEEYLHPILEIKQHFGIEP